MSSATIQAPALVPDEIARAVLLPASYGDLWGTVFPALEWLRAHAPVARAEVEGYDPVWIVSSHEAVTHVLRDAELFHNADANIMMQPQAGDAYLRALLGGTTKVQTNLSYMEPPDHTLFRETTAHGFLPVQVRKFAPRFAELAKTAVDDLLAAAAAGDGVVDVVPAMTARYPLRAVMELLGVPESDYDLMMKLTQDTFGGDDPDWRRDDVDATPEAMAKQWLAAAQDFYRYFLDLTHDRVAHPREDLSTTIVTAKLPDGSLMPEVVQVNLVMSIGLAGHDTVNSATSGGIHGLATHPDQLRLVQENPKLVPALVEESLRWATPAKHFMRNATADTEVLGVPVAAGDRLFCSLQSADQDAAVFADPRRFDVSRRPNPHVAFSFGPHVCLGQHIAKLEMRALFEELVPRVRSLELVEEPRHKVSNFVSGFKALRVRIVPA